MATAIEYGILASAIALAGIVAVGTTYQREDRANVFTNWVDPQKNVACFHNKTVKEEPIKGILRALSQIDAGPAVLSKSNGTMYVRGSMTVDEQKCKGGVVALVW